MKKQPKTKEKRKVKKIGYPDDEIPQKDKDGIDIITSTAKDYSSSQ